MFEHLVESGSHSEDLKRKGSFLLGFTGIYIVLLTVAFVAGIWYATANIDAQTLELTALIAPVPVQAQQKQEAKPEKIEITKNVDVRKELIADVTRADLVPKEVSAKASDIPPVRKGVVTMVGSSNSNAIAPVAPGAGTGNIISAPAKVDVGEAPPPPPPKPTPPKAPISGGVLNGKAVRLVQPPYPAIARSAHASGQVRVQIVIDENGNVISATPVSGHPLLQGAATAAARASKFTPTKLSGMPVKVSGVIIYNFVAQ
ncbi:MAG TPA: TonB family protein [Pyrinomonadaceae bacterium]|jgi:protein TonB|nr:TonB family protein [Pyrinomonadaceae bacterium]